MSDGGHIGAVGDGTTSNIIKNYVQYQVKQGEIIVKVTPSIPGT